MAPLDGEASRRGFRPRTAFATPLARRLATASLLAASVLLALAAAEAILRIRGVVYVYVTPHPDPALRYVLTPGLRGRVAGIEIEHNSRGLRDRDYPDQPPSGVVRILAVGDSITYSRLDPAPRTFIKRLEASLNSGGYGATFEVINGGASGYTSCQEEAFLKNVGLSYNPHVVLWQYCLNDVEDPSDPFDGGRRGFLPMPASFKRALRDHVRVWSFLRVESYEILHLLGLMEKDATSAAYARSIVAFYGEAEVSRRNRAWACILRARDEVVGRGGDMLLVVFPLAMQAAADPAFTDAPQRDVERRCREAGIDCPDLLPVFQREGGWDLYAKPDFLHLSAGGHRVAAAAIEEALRRHLPSGPPPATSVPYP